MIERDGSWLGRARDHLAWGISQFALKHIATPWYRAMIGGSIRLGLRAAVDDERRDDG